jgi:hypothetical protein
VAAVGHREAGVTKQDLITPQEMAQDLHTLAVQSMGWLPIAQKVYLHMGGEKTDEVVITVVGTAEDVRPGATVMWVLGV